jgi:glycerol-3-phosphate responsive antiterminator
MKKNLSDILADSPVIAAVKDEKGLTKALLSECSMIFILYGNICNISDIVEKVDRASKIAIVHADLVNGLSMKEIAVDYIRNNTKAQGIISTKPLLVKRAKELDLIAIQRTFVIDSIAYNNMMKQIKEYEPDAVEILPGVMPSVTADVREAVDLPIIASGLLRSKKDVVAALDAGADAVSTTAEYLWSV